MGTKIILAADGDGLPIGFELASVNYHEVKLAVGTLETVPRRRGGEPKQRPQELVADKFCDSRRFTEWLRPKGIRPTIPPYERRARKLPKLGRPVKAGPGYAERWKVEKIFARLGNLRRLLVRHERYLSAFRACFLVAIIFMSLQRLYE